MERSNEENGNLADFTQNERASDCICSQPMSHNHEAECPLGDHSEEGDAKVLDDDSSPDTSGRQLNWSRDEVMEIEKMIREETKTVRLWRWVVILAMLLVAGGVMTATYFFLYQDETSDFESSFNQLAKPVLDSSRFSAETIRHSCNDFADMITSGALRERAKWPFYTVPSWSVHMDNLLQQTESFGGWISTIVAATQTADWKSYVSANSPEWYGNNSFSPFIYARTSPEDPTAKRPEHPGPYLPVWQVYPLPMRSITNLDLASTPSGRTNMELTIALDEGVVGSFTDRSIFETIFGNTGNPDEPYSVYYQPVYDTFDNSTRHRVASFLIFLRWSVYFSSKLPEGVRGIHLVLENTCNDTATWELVGREAVFLNRSDLHDKSFNRYKLSSPFSTYENTHLAKKVGVCLYTLSVYPSSSFEAAYRSSTPIAVTCLVGTVFLAMVAVFLAYDNFQRKRTTKVVANAAKSNALVTSLFPSNVRDRLLSQGQDNRNTKYSKTVAKLKLQGKGRSKSSLDIQQQQDRALSIAAADNKPIADLFLETTIMFADITGFTAWSSVREPPQVFTLLETVFAALDLVAQKRRIFKVETVGDCYVAATGLPEPRNDHAVAMARFANDTVRTVNEVVKRLELSLGPDTGDLGIRIGIHSGVVTAGVLRGERSRFQLFGDTVNTTARIESTGDRNKIHASKETADLLMAAGKGHWVRPRQDLISAKGKGTIQTYWIDLRHDNSPSTRPSDLVDGDKKTEEPVDKNLWADAEVAESKMERLIDWQVDVFSRLLKQIVARRKTSKMPIRDRNLGSISLSHHKLALGYCMDDLKEIIDVPEFEDQAAVLIHENHLKTELDQCVIEQLRMYISAVAKMYRPNAFHNFEHACHVTMSVTKLLSRIVKPSDLHDVHEMGTEGSMDRSAAGNSSNERMNSIRATREDTHQRTIAFALHQRTYGITSDPLTQFSLLFSALIHDVDHTGVPNSTLIKENICLARAYQNKSVAEQNSINLAWDLLQDDKFRDLRSCIYTTMSESDRFRQLVVQTVLATDIVDQELKVLRNARWDRAFAAQERDESPRDTRNRKATIVIEHLIQASDVAHTMQHWHVYRKWNENFFRECYQAYKKGRAENDPCIGWYKGELVFFDFYIIPLAKKLKKCGVFGVSGDEYLAYAIANRQEWQDRGQAVVEEMVQAIHNEQQQQISSVPNGKTQGFPYVVRDEEEKSNDESERFMNDGEDTRG